MKSILVLGAGLVSRPLVHYLLQKEYPLTVASRTVAKAEALVQGFNNGRALPLNASDDPGLERLVAESTLVISLLPYTHHVAVARHCLAHRKHLITTSYTSAAMQALSGEARDAGIVLLNEMGLDPGIDHMSAMKIIDDIRAAGGSVQSFRSYCGGLPAFQNNTNAFGYKFSWSPSGVVMAGKNSAQYLKDGKIVFVPNAELFRHYTMISIDGVGDFEAYPNRDSLGYQSAYGLTAAKTVFRGTLRFSGWCETMQKANELGLFDDTPRKDLLQCSYRDIMVRQVNSQNVSSLRRDVAAYLHLDLSSAVMKRFDWLGLFDNRSAGNPEHLMDLFCRLLQEKLPMASNDVDMIVLHHRFTAQYPQKTQRITSTLVNIGEQKGDTAMSRTVSLPAAIAADLILSGKLSLRGVQIPVQREIYKPVLKALEAFTVRFEEKTVEA